MLGNGNLLTSLAVVLSTLIINAKGLTSGRHLLNQEAQGQTSGSQEFAKPNYTYYHASDVLLQQIKELAARHPKMLTVEVDRLELAGYSAELHSVTLATGGKYNGDMDTDLRIRALLDFGQHGREPITSEVALRLLLMLVGERPMRKEYRKAWDHLLPHLVLKVVPMENANGRKIVEAGDLCERKNGRGVDTNRNWAVDWGKKEKDYNPAEEYPGTGPFSEPETELLRILASNFQPHLWVNVHSGMEALFMPYDHKRGAPDNGRADSLAAPLKELNAKHLNYTCVVGSGGSAVGYLAHGTATDWMYNTLQVPLAYTFEIYGDNFAHHDDCFRMFNPTTLDLFEAVVSRWSTAFVALLVSLPDILENLPFKMLPHHIWSLESKNRRIQTLKQRVKMLGTFWKWNCLTKKGRSGTRKTSNPRLREKFRLRGSLEGAFLYPTRGLFFTFCLICMSFALLLLVRFAKSRWQWWRWRWQLALSKKKELQV